MTVFIDQDISIISLKRVAWEDAKLPRGLQLFRYYSFSLYLTPPLESLMECFYHTVKTYGSIFSNWSVIYSSRLLFVCCYLQRGQCWIVIYCRSQISRHQEIGVPERNFRVGTGHPAALAAETVAACSVWIL